MKLAVAFLLACFVGLSYQRRYIWPTPFAPRSHLMPLFYSDGRPANIQIAEPQVIDANDALVEDYPENKFRPGSRPGPLFTITTTVTATTTQVVSTPATSSCIPVSAFALGTSSQVITADCETSRRRRSVEADDETNIQPTWVNPVEASAAPSTTDDSITPEIESTFVAETRPWNERPRFLGGGLSLTKLVQITNYVTEYSYTPVMVWKTVNVATARGLSCLPAGYAVCPA